MTTPDSYQWDPEGVESREWTIVNPSSKEELIEHNGETYRPLGEPKYRIVAYDFGVKKNILRCLRRNGFEVTVVKDATAGARHPELGDGYKAALVNFGYIANAVLSTDEVEKAMGNGLLAAA